MSPKTSGSTAWKLAAVMASELSWQRFVPGGGVSGSVCA
jgi:hypothetical protein